MFLIPEQLKVMYVSLCTCSYTVYTYTRIYILICLYCYQSLCFLLDWCKVHELDLPQDLEMPVSPNQIPERLDSQVHTQSGEMGRERERRDLYNVHVREGTCTCTISCLNY